MKRHLLPRARFRPGCPLPLALLALLAHAGTALAASSPAASAAIGAPPSQPASIGSSAVTVYAAGDIADCREYKPAQSPAAQTAALIASGLAADPVARVLTLGDNTYPKGEASEFTQCYAPTWGRFREATLPAPGNHEYYTAGASGYFAYFGQQAGPGYYRAQIGNWRLFSLNSNLKDAAQHARQLAWLQEELAKPGKGCILAYWHHPLFSSGGHGNNPHMASIWKALQDAGADVILAGHDHNYERFEPQDSQGKPDRRGMREFVVGTGGTPLTPALLQRPNSAVIHTASHGVLKLTLREYDYDWEFLAVSGHGRPDGFVDKGSATCH